MIGRVGAVITNGLGAFIGDPNHLVTLGYGNEAEAVVVPQTVFVSFGGGGRELTWQEHLLAKKEKHDLEQQLREKKAELKKVVRKIKAAEKKVEKSEHPEGILANLWKLADRREELKKEIQATHQEWMDVQTLLIAALKQKEYEEEDEEEIEMMLLA